jgi:uncharacterized protein YeaO (DUF488 family)
MARIQTKRWNDVTARADGTRLLVCRYRPRGVRKEDETWDEWQPHLGPSRDLHAAYWGKHGDPIGWAEFKKRYLTEMRDQREAIDALAARVHGGEGLTLLCSSSCDDPERCHRTLLKGLVERSLAR